MFKKLLLASVLAIPAVSNAEGLSYSFAEANYITVDVDGGGTSPDGFGFGGSYLFDKNVFVEASYSALSAGSVDVDTISAGLGLRHGLTNQIDAVVGAGFLSTEVDVGNLGSDDDTGYFFKGGLRAQVMPKLEVNGGLAYAEIFDDGNTSFSLGGVLSLTPELALTGGAGFDDDATTFTIGARYNF